VYYFSWTGKAQVTNILDITDPFLALSSLAFAGAPNDGLVGTCSAHLGTVISDSYPQNHLDAVNQLLGLVDIFATNPVTLYENQANRLKGLGL
jgi:triacylglycerol lipase